MNLKELGDDFFCPETEKIVKTKPYWSFVLMAAMFEFMGKCLVKDAHKSPTQNSRDYFKKSLADIPSLNKYQVLNSNNDLYHNFRCGMLHSLQPDGSLKLTNKKNDLSHNIVGAKELYGDLKNAWEEIKSNPSILNYLESNDALIINNSVSGSTCNQSVTIV